MTKAKNSNEQVALDFVAAYGQLNMNDIESCLAENVTAYITNKDGNVDKVIGRKNYMQRQAESKTDGVEIKLTVPQIVTIINKQISELWMVEALPAHSDSFWK